MKKVTLTNMLSNAVITNVITKENLAVLKGGDGSASADVEYYIDPITGLKAIKQKGIGSSGFVGD
jgi:hypothetical protein